VGLKNSVTKSFKSRGNLLSYTDSCPEGDNRPVVLFLHGFPDTSELWDAQFAILSDAGYRCIAPDTIGCGLSEISSYLRDYNVEKIATDHVALLDFLGIEKVYLVGHDWGAVQAWIISAYYPERVIKQVVLSVGHPTSYARAGFRQKLAGWYIGYFCLPYFSESLLIGKSKLGMRRLFGSHCHISQVTDRLSSPGRLTAALRIYRASLVSVLLKSHPVVSVQTLGIWSKGDLYCLEQQMKDSGEWVDLGWEMETRECSHWIPLDEPAWLGDRLKKYFSS